MQKAILPLMILVLASAAEAAPVFIDNFNDDQQVLVSGNGANPLSSSNGIAIGGNGLGGFRTITIQRTNGISLDYGQALGGLLEMSLSAADSGSLLVIWDGDTNSALNQNGLTPVDLTDGGSNSQIGLGLRSDLVAPVTLTFYSGNGNSSSVTFNSPAQGFAVPFTQLFFQMSSFNVTGGTGANFSAITAATLFLDGTGQPGVDMQIDDISATGVPEPASFGIVLVGLSGLLALRRRKA
jgi:hypothetical protein